MCVCESSSCAVDVGVVVVAVVVLVVVVDVREAIYQQKARLHVTHTDSCQHHSFYSASLGLNESFILIKLARVEHGRNCLLAALCG